MFFQKCSLFQKNFVSLQSNISPHKMINIYINELGRIHDAEIDVKPMMVFTGDSGLGKSYTAFLIDHVYNILSMDRIRFFVQEKIQTLGEKKDKGFSFKFNI